MTIFNHYQSKHDTLNSTESKQLDCYVAAATDSLNMTTIREKNLAQTTNTQ